MTKQVLLKSLSTGLTGLYPESHLGLDPDLVPAEADPDCDCWVKQEEEFVPVSEELDLEEWEKALLLDVNDDKETTDGE